MGHDDHGGAAAGQVLDDVEDLADQLRVERRGGLVEEQHLGLQGERAGDGDALLLAAGELPRVGVRLLGQPDPLQQAVAAVSTASLRGRRSAETGASTMFSSTVRCGKRLKFWKTKPICVRCRRMSFSLQFVQPVARSGGSR